MEILSNFQYIYVVFPLFLAFLCLLRESKIKAISIVVSFILIFVCAETGSDYFGYESIYQNCFLKTTHGEPLFLAICMLFRMMGVSYNLFRVIFLSTFMILFAYAVYKLSNNFSLSFLIAYLVFILYFVSAYRQFATMSIFLFSLYLYLKKDKKILPLSLNLIAIFIHKLAIVQFLILVLIIIYEKSVGKKKSIEKPFLKKYFMIILLLFCGLRVALYILLDKTSVGSALSAILPYDGYSLINFGFVSRILELVVMVNLYIMSRADKSTNLMFSIYFICMLAYIVFPLELIMGRLVNNFRIIEIILIPKLISERKNKFYNEKNLNLNLSKAMLTTIIVIVFIGQMLNQEGYSYFTHMLWR